MHVDADAETIPLSGLSCCYSAAVATTAEVLSLAVTAAAMDAAATTAVSG